MTEMTKHRFTVIQGGNKEHPSFKLNNMVFIDAYVTDTRLMGVLGLCIIWKIIDGGEEDLLHQFFYYDAEEYGLDTYESVRGDNPELIKLIEQNLIGGLGGNKLPLNQAEALNLLASFVSGSKKLEASLAKPTEEYLELLKNVPPLSPKEKAELIKKTCTPLKSVYHLIHYYLMRSFALDSEGAGYLILGKSNPLEPVIDKPGTLCKNTIEEHANKDGSLSYLCEALVDKDGEYEIVLLEIWVSRKKIRDAKINSFFRVSASEAVLMLNRSEYVSVYEILADPVDFDEIFLPLMAGALRTSHDNGRLFMEFNKTNEHVNQMVFRLNEDIHGLFYVSDFGQLLLAAYSLDKIHRLEKFLQKGPLSLLLMPTAKYEFKEPIVYDFIQSDFEDFEDYILSLQ